MTYVIKENLCLLIGEKKIILKKFINKFIDIFYYEAEVVSLDEDGNFVVQECLLKIGSRNGYILSELEARQEIKEYRLISPLIFLCELDNVSIVGYEYSENENEFCYSSTTCDEPEENYLPEEYLPFNEPESFFEYATLMLTLKPTQVNTISYISQTKPDLLRSINFAIQFCQILRFLYQKGWCLYYINPNFITFEQFCCIYDLSGIIRYNTPLSFICLGSNCSPELKMSNQSIDEKSSVYLVGALLYQLIHGISIEGDQTFSIKKIPFISQILSMTLHQLKEKRPTLEETLDLLFESRKIFQPKIIVDAKGMSVVGLSLMRLVNEDKFGISQFLNNYSNSCLLAVVADGMGGMSHGETASQIAVETVMKANLTDLPKTDQEIQSYLNNYVKKANQNILNLSATAGSTITAVLIVGKKLFLAHVGDTRMYLIRHNICCQLSQDHSMVSMLVASGKLTHEEAKLHPQRNVLVRALGSSVIDDNYIQTLNLWGSVSIEIEKDDLVLLCSDGVWDYINPNEFVDTFVNPRLLDEQIRDCMSQVLEKGASDNATLVAIRVIEVGYEGMS